MARTYGRLQCKVWENPGFLALDPPEKITYVMLITQAKLSLVGLLDIKLSRWTGFGVGDLPVTLTGLERSRFVAVDWETQEVLVRSFTRNDPIPPTNMRLRKGLWGAWEAIESGHLRRVAVDNMPDALFVTMDDIPSPLLMCRSDRMERVIEEAFEDPLEQAHERGSESPPTATATTSSIRDLAATGDPTDVLEARRLSRMAVTPKGARSGT